MKRPEPEETRILTDLDFFPFPFFLDQWEAEDTSDSDDKDLGLFCLVSSLLLEDLSPSPEAEPSPLSESAILMMWQPLTVKVYHM